MDQKEISYDFIPKKFGWIDLLEMIPGDGVSHIFPEVENSCNKINNWV